jgi:hypothetical protein
MLSRARISAAMPRKPQCIPAAVNGQLLRLGTSLAHFAVRINALDVK